MTPTGPRNRVRQSAGWRATANLDRDAVGGGTRLPGRQSGRRSYRRGGPQERRAATASRRSALCGGWRGSRKGARVRFRPPLLDSRFAPVVSSHLPERAPPVFERRGVTGTTSPSVQSAARIRPVGSGPFAAFGVAPVAARRRQCIPAGRLPPRPLAGGERVRQSSRRGQLAARSAWPTT